MNKKEFNNIAKRLKMEIDYEISYIYGAFIPREEHSVLSKMKDEGIAITKTPEGTLVWLEKGNSNSGLIHILKRHLDEFTSEGITDIPDFLVELLKSEPIKKGSNLKGLYCDYLFKEKMYRVAFGTNGYIVTVYPID